MTIDPNIEKYRNTPFQYLYPELGGYGGVSGQGIVNGNIGLAPTWKASDVPKQPVAQQPTLSQLIQPQQQAMPQLAPMPQFTPAAMPTSAPTQKPSGGSMGWGGGGNDVGSYAVPGQSTSGGTSSLPTPPTLQQATLGNRTNLSAAEQRLNALLTNPDSLASSASYKFRVAQGQEALQRSLGAKGLLNSGNRLMELTKYGQDMGSQEYEAENARRLAAMSAYGSTYSADNASRIGVANANNSAANTLYGTQVQGATSANAIAAQAAAAARTAANARYGIDVGANTAAQKTLADLYSTQGQLGQAKYATDVGAVTNQNKTLADLYASQNQYNLGLTQAQIAAQNAQTAANPRGPKPYWA